MKIETCPLYHCCVIEKKLEHCGLCNEFPCNDFLTMESNDPNLSSKDAGESAQKRYVQTSENISEILDDRTYTKKIDIEELIINN